MKNKESEDRARALETKLGRDVPHDPVVRAVVDQVRWHGLGEEDALVLLVRLLVGDKQRLVTTMTKILERRVEPLVVCLDPAHNGKPVSLEQAVREVQARHQQEGMHS